jgi:hypothetical protein
LALALFAISNDIDRCRGYRSVKCSGLSEIFGSGIFFFFLEFLQTHLMMNGVAIPIVTTKEYSK